MQSLTTSVPDKSQRPPNDFNKTIKLPKNSLETTSFQLPKQLDNISKQLPNTSQSTTNYTLNYKT